MLKPIASYSWLNRPYVTACRSRSERLQPPRRSATWGSKTSRSGERLSTGWGDSDIALSSGRPATAAAGPGVRGDHRVPKAGRLLAGLEVLGVLGVDGLATDDDPQAGRAVLLELLHASDHDGQLAVVPMEAALVSGALPVPLVAQADLVKDWQQRQVRGSTAAAIGHSPAGAPHRPLLAIDVLHLPLAERHVLVDLRCEASADSKQLSISTNSRGTLSSGSVTTLSARAPVVPGAGRGAALPRTAAATSRWPRGWVSTGAP